MHFLRVVLLCLTLVSAFAFAEDGAQGCAGRADCAPPVDGALENPSCEGADCPERPAIVCEGLNCLPPQGNPPAECEGQDCMPAQNNALEECEGQDCEMAPPPE